MKAKNAILLSALLSCAFAQAQTRIDKCGGSTTFNGSARVSFINLERDTEVTIKLHSLAKLNAASSSLSANITVDGKSCASGQKAGAGGQDVLLTCPGVGIAKGKTVNIVAAQTNSNGDDTGNTLTIECFARAGH